MNQARIFKNISVVPTEGGFLQYVFKSIKLLFFTIFFKDRQTIHIGFFNTTFSRIKQKHQRRTIERQTWNILEGPRDLQMWIFEKYIFQGPTDHPTRAY